MVRKSNNYQLHFTAIGRVQGVGFRYYVQAVASREKLFGWVKNLSNGNVEGILQGSCSSIENVIELIKKGPSLSRVDKVIMDWEIIKTKHNSFDVWY